MPTTARWLSALARLSQRPDVGCAENNIMKAAAGKSAIGAREILIADQDLSPYEDLITRLAESGLGTSVTHDMEEAATRLRSSRFALMLAGLGPQSAPALHLLAVANNVRPEMWTIVTAPSPGCVETAIQASRLGAFDYVTKPFRTDDLLASVRKALDTPRGTTPG